jgi:adenylylsulfate kinase-like enzyme
MSALQRSPRDGGDDPAARLHRRTDELHGSDAAYEKTSDADLRLETVDSDPADNARRIVDALERG